jgi:hypothetical protein
MSGADKRDARDLSRRIKELEDRFAATFRETHRAFSGAALHEAATVMALTERGQDDYRSGRLPSWETRDQRERNELKYWTIACLDEERAIKVAATAEGGSNNTGSVTLWLAMLAAQHDNMQPLKALHPDLAPYLHERKRGPGEYPRHRRPWALQQAMDDVGRIRALWKARYGRWKRKDDLAIEIAAERWKIEQEELHNAMKQTSRK